MTNEYDDEWWQYVHKYIEIQPFSVVPLQYGVWNAQCDSNGMQLSLSEYVDQQEICMQMKNVYVKAVEQQWTTRYDTLCNDIIITIIFPLIMKVFRSEATENMPKQLCIPIP